MLWRQGDLYIAETDSVPERAIARQAGGPGYDVLADGEATGHRHRIENSRAAVLLDDRGQLYLIVVAAKARIVHDEHGPIELERGNYRVWRQREYVPTQWANFDAPRLKAARPNKHREYDPAQWMYSRTVTD